MLGMMVGENSSIAREYLQWYPYDHEHAKRIQMEEVKNRNSTHLMIVIFQAMKTLLKDGVPVLEITKSSQSF